ncbi:MAG: trimethylamine corrinoid protein 2 [Clostridia bacterium]|nr:trimethylamine corrinoid protein 2 [Clostridia bacterium]
MRYKPDFETVRQRLLAFWEGEVLDRPCIAVTAPKTPEASRQEARPADPEALRASWTDPQIIRRDFLRKLEGTYLGGDAMPVIPQNHGTSGHCTYFGAEPLYDQETIWFRPALEGLEPERLRYRPGVLARHLAITEYLAAHAADDYLIGMPDSCGTLDALAHLYGSGELLIAMLEEPDAVARAIRIVNDGWADSNERFYQAAYAANRGGCAHPWMHLWAPGRLQHMQCDLSVMISPDMFERLVAPELEQQMEWSAYPVYHFDGIEQERHLGHLLSLSKLRAIQWTNVDGQAPPRAYLSVLKRIQAAGKNLILMTPAQDVPELLKNLSPAGLYLHCRAGSPEEADALVRCAAKSVMQTTPRS